MTTDKDIDIFINWLVDNNYFNEFVHNFKVNNNIYQNIFFELKKRLKETNIMDFVDVSYKNEERNKEWKKYCDFNLLSNEKFIPKKGDYISYNVTRFGVTCRYVSIVGYYEVWGKDVSVYELCSLCIESDDEELVDIVEYGMEFCLSSEEGITGFRKATAEEINKLNEYLKEDGFMFDANIFKLVEI